MSYQSIQQQVEEIFEESTSQFVVHQDQKCEKLIQKCQLPISNSESIKILKDVIEGIIYIQSRMLIHKPAQIFKEHIVRNDANWAICNVICYRNQGQRQWKGDPQKYHPLNYQFHADEESQLVWSLGALWYELLTSKQLPPISQFASQEVLDHKIHKEIKDIRISSFLQNILVIKCHERIIFSDLMNNPLFENQKRSFDKSLVQFISKISISGKVKRSTKQVQGTNPFQEKIFQRDFKQILVIWNLFDKVKKYIKSVFEAPDQNDQIDLSLYLIDLKLLQKLRNFESLRESKGFNSILYEEKEAYSKFLNHLLHLENYVDRQRKKPKFNKFRDQYGKCLCSLENIDVDLVYTQFKSYLTVYAQQLYPRKKQLKYFRNLILILLVRCSDYVFANARQYLFKAFLSDPTSWDLSDIIKNIEKCEDWDKLNELERKIYDFYFSERKHI